MKNFTIKRANGEVIKLSAAEACQVWNEYDRYWHMQAVEDALKEELGNGLVDSDDIPEDLDKAVDQIMNWVGSNITDNYESGIEYALDPSYEIIENAIWNYQDEIKAILKSNTNKGE